jgi:hypothetical protein
VLTVVTLALSTVAMAADKTAKELKIENFVKLPGARMVQISPDGKHISMVLRKNEQEMVEVPETTTMKAKGVYKVIGDKMGVGNVYWVNNERLVYSVTESNVWDKRSYPNGELFGVNVDGKRHKLLFGYRKGLKKGTTRSKGDESDRGGSQIIDLLEGDDDNVLVHFYPWRQRMGTHLTSKEGARPIIYKLNVYTGRKKRIDELPLPLTGVITDAQGNLRFAAGTNDDNEIMISYKEKPSDDCTHGR